MPTIRHATSNTTTGINRRTRRIVSIFFPPINKRNIAIIDTANADRPPAIAVTIATHIIAGTVYNTGNLKYIVCIGSVNQVLAVFAQNNLYVTIASTAPPISPSAAISPALPR